MARGGGYFPCDYILYEGCSDCLVNEPPIDRIEYFSTNYWIKNPNHTEETKSEITSIYSDLVNLYIICEDYILNNSSEFDRVYTFSIDYTPIQGNYTNVAQFIVPKYTSRTVSFYRPIDINMFIKVNNYCYMAVTFYSLPLQNTYEEYIPEEDLGRFILSSNIEGYTDTPDDDKYPLYNPLDAYHSFFIPILHTLKYRVSLTGIVTYFKQCDKDTQTTTPMYVLEYTNETGLGLAINSSPDYINVGYSIEYIIPLDKVCLSNSYSNKGLATPFYTLRLVGFTGVYEYVYNSDIDDWELTDNIIFPDASENELNLSYEWSYV